LHILYIIRVSENGPCPMSDDGNAVMDLSVLQCLEWRVILLCCLGKAVKEEREE